MRERMMTMEAELRALKDELSNRGSSSLASNTSSQVTLKEKDELEKADNNVANETPRELVATPKNNDAEQKSNNENEVETVTKTAKAEENT